MDIVGAVCIGFFFLRYEKLNLSSLSQSVSGLCPFSNGHPEACLGSRPHAYISCQEAEATALPPFPKCPCLKILTCVVYIAPISSGTSLMLIPVEQ